MQRLDDVGRQFTAGLDARRSRREAGRERLCTRDAIRGYPLLHGAAPVRQAAFAVSLFVPAVQRRVYVRRASQPSRPTRLRLCFFTDACAVRQATRIIRRFYAPLA